jgi:ankyrin repeat protein
MEKVYGSTNVPPNPSPRHAELLDNDVEEIGPELASMLTQDPGLLSRLTSMDDGTNLDTAVGRQISNVGNQSALSSVSRADKTSHILLSLLYSVNNNLFSKSQASEVYQVIFRGINRKFFKALIANVSPVTKTIARMFLPAAVQCLDVSLVKALLATGVDTNFKVHQTREHLFVAAISGCNVEIVQHFLDHGAHVNFPSDGWRYTPLEAAAKTGRVDLVRLLLEAGAEMNVAEPNSGSSALCLAASYGTLELVQLLVDAGAVVGGSMRQEVAAGYLTSRSTPLYHAVRRADVAMVEYLISCGADLNVLGAAVSNGDMPMLQLLISHGANDVLDAMISADHPRHQQVVRFLVHQEFDTHGTLQHAFGEAALEAAVRCNDNELLTWLLDFGISAIVTPAALSEALGTAVRRGYLSITQLLVARGADVNAGRVDTRRQSVLQHAVSLQHRHIVEFLLRSGADVNAPGDITGRMAIAIAIHRHRTEIVHMLLASGADMNKQGPSAVVAAIEVASPELLRVVLDAWMLAGDIDIDHIMRKPRLRVRPSETPPSLASRCAANVELTQLLFDYNLCKAEDTSSALPKAVESGNLEVVRLLLASGAHVGYAQDELCWNSDTEGRYYRFATSLDEAARSGNMDILNLLLQHPTTVEERSRALQVAAFHNNLDAVMSLLRLGADVNAAPLASGEHISRTALQAAAATGDLKLVRYLLDAGATVESIAPSARYTHTALQLAAIAGSIGVVAALIQRGADVRAPAMYDWGYTALEGAAEYGRLDTVQLLIKEGAEVTGSSAVRYARRSGHDGVVALLLSNGFEDNFDESMKNRDIRSRHGTTD